MYDNYLNLQVLSPMQVCNYVSNKALHCSFRPPVFWFKEYMIKLVTPPTMDCLVFSVTDYMASKLLRDSGVFYLSGDLNMEGPLFILFLFGGLT